MGAACLAVEALKTAKGAATDVMALEGTLGYDIKPGMRRFQNSLLVYENMRLLSTSLFSQFIDPLNMVVRGGTMSDAWNAYKRGLREVVASIKGDPIKDLDAQISAQVGTLDANGFLAAFGQLQSRKYMGDKFRKVNEAMLRFNGMEGFNRGMQIAGNVVAAIAPPAERELRQQFTANLDKLDSELFDKTLQLLKWLPELGVLLQVERELPNLIRQVYVGKGTGLFAQQEQERWQQADIRLREAPLTEFARAAQSTYQGRLFAQDALQGLHLIDLCRTAFDVVVMNPPFGAPTASTYTLIRDCYRGSHNDIYASFVARATELAPKGYVGCISSRSFLLSPRLEHFRVNVVLSRLSVLADLGWGVMDDALVEAAAYVLHGNGSDSFKALDLRKQQVRAIHR
jgi:hypothetical protein